MNDETARKGGSGVLDRAALGVQLAVSQAKTDLLLKRGMNDQTQQALEGFLSEVERGPPVSDNPVGPSAPFAEAGLSAAMADAVEAARANDAPDLPRQKLKPPPAPAVTSSADAREARPIDAVPLRPRPELSAPFAIVSPEAHFGGHDDTVSSMMRERPDPRPAPPVVMSPDPQQVAPAAWPRRPGTAQAPRAVPAGEGRWVRSALRWSASAACLFAIMLAVVTWLYIDGVLHRKDAEDGRAIATQILYLAALETQPQSALGCLDAGTGDTLGAACERLVFGSPDNLAGANAYVAAQLRVLGDAVDYTKRLGLKELPGMAALRQSLENDRLGVVAHVVATQYGCTATKCAVLARLANPDKVLANLDKGRYEDLQTRHLAHWGEAPAAAAAPVPPAPAPSPTPEASVGKPAASKPMLGLNLPPVSSMVPAITIMADEPKGPPPASPPVSSPPVQDPPAVSPPAPRAPSGGALAPPIQLTPGAPAE